MSIPPGSVKRIVNSVTENHIGALAVKELRDCLEADLQHLGSHAETIALSQKVKTINREILEEAVKSSGFCNIKISSEEKRERLPLSPTIRALKLNKGMRTTEDAKEIICDLATTQLIQTINMASRIATGEKRITIKPRDVKAVCSTH